MTLALGIVSSALIGAIVTPRGAVETAVGKPQRRRTRRGWVALAVSAGLLSIIGWAALPALRVRTDVERYAAGLPALRDAQQVAATVGSSAELDVVLTGPNVLTPAAYSWMTQAQDQVLASHGDVAHPIVSAPALMSFLGANPTAEEIDAGARLIPAYLLGAAVAPDHGIAVLSFGVDLSHLPKIGELVSEIQAHLPPAPQGYTAMVGGLPVVAARGEYLVSADRWLANIAGILAASVVLAAGLRRRTDAIRALATAVMANGLGLLTLWATGVALTPLTVPLGALTGAVACEFTVMLAESERAERSGIRVSVALAVAASAAGYLTLLASSLGMIRQFGVLLAGAVVIAWLSAQCVVAATTRRRQDDPPQLFSPQKILIGARS
jgi:predicted RND superfamily exporter protein